MSIYSDIDVNFDKVAFRFRKSYKLYLHLLEYLINIARELGIIYKSDV